MKLKNTAEIFLLLLSSMLIYSCANQLPPQGGDIDRIPPKAVSITPLNGTVNYTGNSFTIEFDKYVDRRSFRESLFISPKPKGELDYSWSGKEVKVSFSEPPEKNKTYLVTIGKSLKDQRQGNTLSAPITFAFSTGAKIDRGKVSGKVFNLSERKAFSDAYKNLLIAAFLTDGKDINPDKTQPDYICPVSDDGTYSFINLPEGKVRLFAILDNDRNFMFNKDYDNISVPESDIDLSDTNVKSVSNFLINLSPTYFFESILEIWNKADVVFKSGDNTFYKFINSINKDSTGTFFSTLKNKDSDIPVRPSIYLYFKNNPNKLSITESISITDTSVNRAVPLEYQWMNDSIIRVTPQQNLSFGTNYKLSAIGNNTLFFRTVEQRKTGIFILKNGIKTEYNVFFYLFNNDKYDVIFSSEIKKNEDVEIKDINAGTYTLFVYLDANGNGRYDRGSFYPFVPSEPFYIRDDITIKGQWNTEDVLKGFF
jgi:hypothetical protein